ncbi:hypothetical protein JCM16358_20640 [Halanaerocella petrolearia]
MPLSSIVLLFILGFIINLILKDDSDSLNDKYQSEDFSNFINVLEKVSNNQK